MTRPTSEPTRTTQVSLSQVAELAGVGPSAVSNWRKRFADFPAPVGATASGQDLFLLSAVQRWLDDNGRGIPEQRNERIFFEAADLLRSEGPTDRVTELLCAAASLVYAALAPGVTEAPGAGRAPAPAALIKSVEGRDAGRVGLFEVLAELPDGHVAHLLDVVRQLDRDGLRELFEWALARRGRFVETRTHDALADLIAGLAGHGAKRVFDPAVGEGGFLITASRLDTAAPTLYGQEVNRAAWRIAGQRLLVCDISATIALGDSLTDDAFPDLRADVVYCDPPYGAVPRWRDDLLTDGRWLFGIPTRENADFAWIQHVIHHLAPEGRGYVLLPASTLFRRGREAEIRRELVRRGAVEAIVSLGAGAAQHTTVPLSLWIVRRPPAAGEPAPVLFIDAGPAGASRGGGIDARLADDIKEAVRQWRTPGRPVDPGGRLARGVPFVEILATDSNLLPSRWVHATRPVASGDRRAEFAGAFTRLERARKTLAEDDLTVERLMASVPSARSWTPVRHLIAAGFADIVRGVRVRPEDCQATGVRALRTRDVKAGIAEAEDPCYVDPDTMRPRPVLTEPGDIIVSPGSGKPIATVDTAGGYVLVYPLQALRIKGDLADKQVIASFLESSRNRRFLEGTSAAYARLDLSELEVPMLPRDETERLGAALRRIAAYEDLSRELAESARIARDALLELAGADNAPLRGQASSATTGEGDPR
jgi:hypothetical protein